MKPTPFIIPADVPQAAKQTFTDNYNAITKDTGRLHLFTCDQKIEHLNKDFHLHDAPPTLQDPATLFKIAQDGRVGAMASHIGLINRYAQQYSNINYIVKLNAKTNIIRVEQHDPIAALLTHVDQVVTLKQESQLPIRGIGITVYLGSEYEATMLEQASQAIFDAHQAGLVAIIWMYPRGKAVVDDSDPDLLAGCAGAAASLGADFVKIKKPYGIGGVSSPQQLKTITTAAGNTKVICSGGSKQEIEPFLKTLYEQLHIGETDGSATGRNIFQRPLEEAIAMSKAIADLVFDEASVDTAMKQFKR